MDKKIRGGFSGPASLALMSSLTVFSWPRLMPAPRGLDPFASQLNLSASYGIGGARRGYVARVKGVLGGAYGV